MHTKLNGCLVCTFFLPPYHLFFADFFEVLFLLDDDFFEEEVFWVEEVFLVEELEDAELLFDEVVATGV